MTQKEFRSLLQRYKAGKATVAERELVEKWFDAIGQDDQPNMSLDEEQALERQFQGYVHRHIAEKSSAKDDNRRFLPYWRAAAVAASLLLVCGLIFYYSPTENELAEAIPMRSEQDVEKLETVAATTLQRVQLTDGSTVTLQPGSSISYDAQNFGNTGREVFLQGEGFFEVAHNPQKPFYVFSGEVATKVLGTSFTVKTVGSRGQIVVAVNTGRVAVATRQSKLFGLSESFKEAAVLTPNQQAVFDLDDKVLLKGLVEEPRIIHPAETPGQIEFDDVALTEILEELEKAYEIDIVFDAEKISACFVTAKFDKESLFERLNIICRVAGARYEVQGPQIIIHK